MGLPGTGKNALAKAVAGEAGVPFFNLGSDFVEMFVGVGASKGKRSIQTSSRKRRLVLFLLMEIDAMGRARGRKCDSRRK